MHLTWEFDDCDDSFYNNCIYIRAMYKLQLFLSKAWEVLISFTTNINSTINMNFTKLWMWTCEFPSTKRMVTAQRKRYRNAMSAHSWIYFYILNWNHTICSDQTGSVCVCVCVCACTFSQFARNENKSRSLLPGRVTCARQIVLLHF